MKTVVCYKTRLDCVEPPDTASNNDDKEGSDLFSLPQFDEWMKCQYDGRREEDPDDNNIVLNEDSTTNKAAYQDPVDANNSVIYDGNGNDDDLTTCASTAVSTACTSIFSGRVIDPRRILEDIGDAFWSCGHDALDVMNCVVTGESCRGNNCCFSIDYMNERGCYGDFLYRRGYNAEYDGESSTNNSSVVKKTKNNTFKGIIKRKMMFQKKTAPNEEEEVKCTTTVKRRRVKKPVLLVPPTCHPVYQGRSKML